MGEIRLFCVVMPMRTTEEAIPVRKPESREKEEATPEPEPTHATAAA